MWFWRLASLSLTVISLSSLVWTLEFVSQNIEHTTRVDIQIRNFIKDQSKRGHADMAMALKDSLRMRLASSHYRMRSHLNSSTFWTYEIALCEISPQTTGGRPTNYVEYMGFPLNSNLLKYPPNFGVGKCFSGITIISKKSTKCVIGIPW